MVNQVTKELEEALSPRRVQFIEQGEQLGTGHALLTAAPQFKGLTGNLLVLCADTPLIRVAVIHHNASRYEEALTTLSQAMKLPPQKEGSHPLRHGSR